MAGMLIGAALYGLEQFLDVLIPFAIESYTLANEFTGFMIEDFVASNTPLEEFLDYGGWQNTGAMTEAANQAAHQGAAAAHLAGHINTGVGVVQSVAALNSRD